MDYQKSGLSCFRFAYTAAESFSECFCAPECLMESKYPLCVWSEDEPCYNRTMLCSFAERAPVLFFLVTAAFETIGTVELPLASAERFGLEAAVREERRKYAKSLFFSLAILWAENGFDFPCVQFPLEKVEEIFIWIYETSPGKMLERMKRKEKGDDFFNSFFFVINKEFKSISLMETCQKTAFFASFSLLRRMKRDRKARLLEEAEQARYEKEKTISQVDDFIRGLQ